MESTVLQPVRRRRRRRKRIVWRRLTPLLALGMVALAAGLVAGSRAHGSGSAPARAASAAAPKAKAAPAKQRVVVPEKLVVGPARVHRPLAAFTAPAGIVIDASTGRVLWEKDAHARRQIASLTKIMTALLALEELDRNKVVTVDPSVTRVPLVREGLRAGEQVVAWKLFYGTLLYSGNDSALELGIATAGTRSKFVHRMNDEAKRLGLHDTHFRSPSGVVDVDNYSSAWDLAALTRVAMRNARFRAIVRTKRKQIPWNAPTYSKIYVNKNRLLQLYPGATGVKTGYTHMAGPCIVASATRHGVSLIAVALDSRDIYADAKRLLDLGFSVDAA